MLNIRAQILELDKISICGNGTRGGQGERFALDESVIEYAPDELYITVGAGMTMEALEDVLSENAQMLSFDPMDHRSILGTQGVPTIGGAVGVNLDGPRRIRCGSIRDSVLGLKFIDGTAQEIRTGGKVMKNVTGLDLTKFFVGSRGGLGVAKEFTLKVLPKPKEFIYLSAQLDWMQTFELVGKAMRMPLDISGMSWTNDKVFVRLEGDQVKQSRLEMENMIGACEMVQADEWESLRDWAHFSDADEVWRIFLNPSQVSLLLPNLNLDNTLVQMGGTQIVTAASVQKIQSLCKNGIFAVCEKGARGQRLPSYRAPEKEIRSSLLKVFDPNNRFSGQEIWGLL